MAMTKGAITVFAPTDEAMARLDEETRAKVREMPSLFVLWPLHDIRNIFLSNWHWDGEFVITYYKLYIIVMQYWLSNRKFISALRRVLRPLHPPLPHSQARHLLRCHSGCHVYKESPTRKHSGAIQVVFFIKESQKKHSGCFKKKPHKCRFLWWLCFLLIISCSLAWLLCTISRAKFLSPVLAASR